jgi:hypothetical protein
LEPDEIVRLKVTRPGAGTLDLARDETGAWRLDPAGDGVRRERIGALLAKLTGREAKEFLSSPLDLKKYGLDHPRAEVELRSVTGRSERLVFGQVAGTDFYVRHFDETWAALYAGGYPEELDQPGGYFLQKAPAAPQSQPKGRR